VKFLRRISSRLIGRLEKNKKKIKVFAIMKDLNQAHLAQIVPLIDLKKN